MNYKKTIPRKTKQEQPLKSSQLIVRTFVFLTMFFILWFTIVYIWGIPKDKLLLSEVRVAYTWIISVGIGLFIWLSFLVFIAKDTSLKKIWETMKPVTSHSNKKFTKWSIFLFILIIIIYFSKPSLYSNINAIRHDVLFEGKTFIKEEWKSGDKRFVKVFIENSNKKYVFEGKTEEINPLINREVPLIIYQGIFTRYALIEK